MTRASKMSGSFRPETARAIKRAIAPACLVGLVPSLYRDESITQSRDRIERILALKPSFVQFFRDSVPDELVPVILAAGVPVIIDGAEMNEDDHLFVEPDDPVSFFRFWASMGAELHPILLHTEVSGMVHPWPFLTRTALEWPDECLQIEDVAAATRRFPLLLDLAGVRPDEIGPYVQAFPDARGFFATLGPGPDELQGISSTPLEPLLAALRTLQTLQGGEMPERN